MVIGNLNMSTKHNFTIILLIVLGIVTVFFLGVEVVRQSRADKSEVNPYAGIGRPIDYAESPQDGAAEARLALFEYGDFACPACRTMQPVVEKILTKYVGKLRHVWKDFPVHGDLSRRAAAAARCAGVEGKFWAYHDWLFAQQENLAKIDYSAGARAAGVVKLNDFTACLGEESRAKLAERDALEAEALGFEATPTFVIGDRAFSGIVSFEDFERVVQVELGKAQ